MVCSQCQGIEKFFDRREAERKLRRYRKSGPGKSTRILIDAIKEHSVDGKTLLDIGGGVGADGYPFLLAVATIALAIFLTLQAVFRRERQTPAEAPGIQGNEPPVFKRAVWCFLSVVIYTALLLPIGYLITTPILLVVLMRILGDRRWAVPLVNALLLTLGMFVAFRYGVNIVLPEGVLGNLSN